MGGAESSARVFLLARVLAVAAGSLALANCSGGLSGKLDPRYGVSASARVIAPGEPVPKGGGRYRVGKPYTVAGRVYIPEEDANYTATGVASWYGDDFHGRYTANGEIYDMNAITAAHKTLPLPSYVRVTNLKNHRSIVVRVNDRGPYAADRVIDLSVKTAKLLNFYGHGLARVKVEYVGRAPLEGSDDRKLMATLREGTQPETSIAKLDKSLEAADEASVERPAAAPIRVASNRPFAPAYFDARPLTNVPRPPERPFGGTRQFASLDSHGGGEIEAEPIAPARASAVQNSAAPSISRAVSAPAAASTVSAFAPTRYDGHAGFMGGRGLY